MAVTKNGTAVTGTAVGQAVACKLAQHNIAFG